MSVTTNWQTTGVIDPSLVSGAGNFGGIQTHKVFGNAGASVGAAYSFLQSFTFEGPYNAVRFAYGAYSAATYGVIAKTAALPSVTDNGTGLTWANVTFDGSATAQAGDFWNGAAGSVTSGTVPASISGSGANCVPSLFWTDWIPQDSVACTDPGLSDLCMTTVRTYSSTTGYQVLSSSTPSSNMGDYNANSRRKSYGLLVAGDQVSTITAQTMNSGPTWMPVIAAQAILRKPVYNHGIFGDSISKGQGAFSDAHGGWGWAHRAVQALTDSGRGTHSLANFAVSGQGKDATWRTAQQVIPQRCLDVATFFPWSPNDGQTTINNFRYQLGQFLALCKRYGVVPILCTSPPAAQITLSANDLLRQALNAEIRSMRGVIVADFDAVLSDSASPARYIAGLTNTDNIHPSAAGHEVMKTVYMAAVARAFGV